MLKSEDYDKEILDQSNIDILTIDGSQLEGGGQILRISLALSSILNRKIKIIKIRGNRDKPGLKNQHTASCNILALVCNGKLTGCKVDSNEIEYLPEHLNIKTGSYECDIGSAGSIGLVIQQILPCIIFGKEKTVINMKGGTIVSHSPSTVYIRDVLIDILKFYGFNFSVETSRHGIFPIGGGYCKIEVEPVKELKPVEFTKRGLLKSVLIKLVYSQNMNNEGRVETILKDIQKEMKKLINKHLKDYTEEQLEEIKIITDTYKINITKGGHTMFIENILYFENTRITFEYLYSEKKFKNITENEYNGKIISVAEDVLLDNFICLDEFTVDHLIIFSALANGKSILHIGEVSKHTITALTVIQSFLPKFKFNIIPQESKVLKDKINNIIEIEGIAFKRII